MGDRPSAVIGYGAPIDDHELFEEVILEYGLTLEIYGTWDDPQWYVLDDGTAQEGDWNDATKLECINMVVSQEIGRRLADAFNSLGLEIPKFHWVLLVSRQ